MQSLKFTQQDAEDAWNLWGFNCGPAALCAAIGLTPNAIRPVFEAIGFTDIRRFTSPTMMKRALEKCGVSWNDNNVQGGNNPTPWTDFPLRLGLVRIQWEGPWTKKGANPKWAYTHTHWISVCKPKTWDTNQAILYELDPIVFDINGGLMRFDQWRDEIVPLLTKAIPRADGDWYVTHCWEIQP